MHLKLKRKPRRPPSVTHRPHVSMPEYLRQKDLERKAAELECVRLCREWGQR